MSDQPPPAPGPSDAADADAGLILHADPPPGVRRWAPREPWIEPGDLRAAGLVAVALAVLGVPAGAVWSAISPHSQGFVAAAGSLVPDETEAYVAADGRYLFITAMIGLLAGALGWFWRSRRGPVLATGLALGGLAGALITALVGHWLSSGHATGAVNSIIGLRITLHARNLVAIEAAAALAVYLLGVLGSSPDDLGRPGRSVDAGLDVQQVGRDGHGPDAAQ